MTRELALPLSLLFPAVTALAQGPTEMIDSPILVPANVTKLAAAEVYGNEDLYGLAIADNRVNLIAAPNTFRSVNQLGTAASWTVNDLCILKGRVAGGRDAILSVGPDGLKLTSLQVTQQGLPLGDPEPTQFATVPVTDPVTAPGGVTIATGAWLGASRVIAELAMGADGFGFVQVAGLSATGQTLITGVWQNGIFTNGPSVTFPRPVRELVLLHWQAGDPTFEIALLNYGNQVEVRDFASLTVLANSAAGAAPGFLATMRHASPPEAPQPPADVLAWARPTAPGPTPNWDLVFFNVGGNGMAADGTAVRPLAYPEVGASSAFSLRGIVAGDFDHDCIDEVLAVPTFLPGWLVFYQDPGAGTLVLTIRQGEQQQAQLCMPVIADFDHDGFNDLLVSLEEVHSAMLIHAMGGDPPTVFPDDMSIIDVSFSGNYSVMSWSLSSLPPADAYNKIEIAVWREQYNASGQPAGLDPVPFDVAIHDRGPDGAQDGVTIRFPNALDTSPIWATPKINVWGRVRLLYVTNTGAIQKASRSYFFGFQPPTAIPLFPNGNVWPGVYADPLNPGQPYQQFRVAGVCNRDDVPIQPDLSFGLKFMYGGRRIFAGVIVPLHGLPATATGTLPGI